MAMRCSILGVFLFLSLFGCVTDSPPAPADDYEELSPTKVIESPDPVAGGFHPDNRDKIERGAYMVELLGCGSCHTNGAFDGSPDMKMALAGSSTGIAFSNPMGDAFPGVVYPPNLTPDDETGIGSWSDRQIANAIRAGVGRHGKRRIAAMPWQGYSRLTDDDIDAMVAYLRSIKPIRNIVPAEVNPGDKATRPFVYFGVYRSKK
jgi:mono/diheme cytochrome c family protein